MSPAAPTPRRTYALASWLGGGSAALVVIALALMAIASSLIVRRQTERQAWARAELAVSAARDAVRRAGDDALGAARTLAGRPTLQRVAADAGSRSSLEYLLQNYCTDNHLSACAIALPDGTVIAAGAAQSWPEILRAHAEQGERFAFAPRGGGAPLIGAAARIGTVDGVNAIVVRALDAALLADTSHELGATLRVTNFLTYQAPAADPLTPLHSRAIAGAARPVARVQALDAYVSSSVLANPVGEPVALLDAELPAAGFAAAVKAYDRVLLLVTLVVGVIVGAAGLRYGRWLAAPVSALAEMARRIGRGDFSPPVPEAEPRELAALGHAMDEMRHNLVALTDSLRRSEAEAQAVLAGVVEGVFVVDEQRRLHYANPQFLRMLEVADTDVTGRFCGDVLHARRAPEERPCERDCPILAARAGAAARCAEQLLRADGTLRSTVVVSSPPTDGRQVQLLRDETELEAARRARDSVLGNISHEFRTPLAAQLAAIELLRDGLETLERGAQRELLGNVERGVIRLMRLIDNLLESVRIESGQLAIRSLPIDLDTVVSEAIELVAPLLPQRGLTIETALPALPAGALRGDAQRLVQVFVNLLSNAIKFGPEGSVIRIGGRAQAGQCTLWVEDEGPGVPPGDPAALFERFRRGGATEPDAPGLGLGLWIARSIVERHAGQIGVERTASGRTRFNVTLPLTEP